MRELVLQGKTTQRRVGMVGFDTACVGGFTDLPG